MEQPSYKIETDTAAGLIRATLSGFWDGTIVSSYARDLEKAITSLDRFPRGSNALLFFVDLRESGVQPADLMGQLQEVVAKIASEARRSAVITSTTLQKLQSQRVVEPDARFRFFGPDDEQIALAWLLSAEIA